MTTWVPTHAPNLWGHPSWECPSCSRAMYAAHLWNMTLTGHISSSGSLFVLHLSASSTPHEWAPHYLGFSLTGNWCVVWDPPLVAQICCMSHRCSTSLHCRGHIRTSWWSMSDHSSVPWRTCLARHWRVSLVGPTLRGPIITSGQTTSEDWSIQLWNFNLFKCWNNLLFDT